MKRSPPSFETNENNYAVVGRSAVAELLGGERDVDKLFIQKGELKGAIHELVAKARAKGIPVVAVDKAKLDAMAAGAAHQGVAAYAAALRYAEPEELVELLNRYFLIRSAEENRRSGCPYCGRSGCQHFRIPNDFSK